MLLMDLPAFLTLSCVLELKCLQIVCYKSDRSGAPSMWCRALSIGSQQHDCVTLSDLQVPPLLWIAGSTSQCYKQLVRVEDASEMMTSSVRRHVRWTQNRSATPMKVIANSSSAFREVEIVIACPPSGHSVLESILLY